MKIYDREGAPNPARIRIVLAEKGIEDQIEFVSIDLIGAEQKSAKFLAKNPIGKIPLLELEDGTVISESTAITVYLDNLDGKPTLTGTTPREKAVIHMMQRRAEMLILETVDDYFHYGTSGLGSALKPWRKTEWSGAREWGIRRGAEAVSHMPYFDNLLSQQSFLAGDKFSMADISLFMGLGFAQAAGLAISPELKSLHAWRAVVAELPSVKNRSGQSFSQHDLDRIGK